jgi:hypothetical protein
VRTTTDGNIEITTPNATNKVWEFGTDGSLTLPGDIRSENAINIDINLSDSTLRRWRFGEDGGLTLPIGVSIDANVDPLYPKIIADSGKAFSVQAQGTSGSAALAWTVNPDAASQYAAVAVSKGGGDNLAKVVLQAQSDSGDAGTAKIWKFDETGTTTLPGVLVNSTVAKTGVILPTTTGVVDTLAHNSVLTGLTDAQYGPFTLGTVTFSVTVSGGVINNFVSVSSTANVTINDVLGTIDSGNIGGTAGTAITVTVDGIVQATPTAIDLTKSVNKLTDGVYTLANGVEGQIMYLVAQNGVVPANVSVLVANSRNIGEGTLSPFSVYDNSDSSYYDNIGGFCTLIFTDGAWQQSGGAWGSPT